MDSLKLNVGNRTLVQRIFCMKWKGCMYTYTTNELSSCELKEEMYMGAILGVSALPMMKLPFCLPTELLGGQLVAGSYSLKVF